MDFGNERYVRLYVRDTVTWKRLGWDGQNALTQMLRKADRSGVIDLGGIEPWESLVVLCGAPEDAARRGMARCLELDCIVHDGDRLVFPRYLEAQECAQSDAQRQRESRARRGALSRYAPTTVTNRDHSESQNVTESHAESHAVTPSHAASQPVTPCRTVPYRADPSVPSEIARAHEEQNTVQLGHDLLFNATGLAYAGPEWSRQLDRIGMKPEFERRAVLEAIQSDPWCKANKYAVDPDHVLKKWNRYAAGNKPLQPVATPTHAAQQAGATLAKLETELAQLVSKRRALDKSDPEYDVKVYEAERDINAARERRDSARRKLDATG